LSGDLQFVITVEENPNPIPKSCSKFVKTFRRPSKEKQFLKLLEDFVIVADYVNMANIFLD
jgi:hypothetical protein